MKEKSNEPDTSKPRRQPGGDGKRSETLPENAKERTDERLDEGVEETFPASDPVSVKITK